MVFKVADRQRLIEDMVKLDDSWVGAYRIVRKIEWAHHIAYRFMYSTRVLTEQ